MILNKNSPKYRELLWKAVANEREDGKVLCNICDMEVIPGDDWEPWNGDWHESHTGIPKAHGGFTVGIAHARCNLDDGHEVTRFVAKGKRIFRKHHGIIASGRGPNPLPAGRRSDVKKKLNGEIVPRLKERGSEHRRVMSQFPNWRGE